MSRMTPRLKMLRIGAVVTALMCLSRTCGADDQVDPVVQSLVAAHNAERQRVHKGVFKLSSKLCEAAEAHAADMAKHHKIGHKGNDGSTVVDRIKLARLHRTFGWVRTSPTGRRPSIK